MLLYYLSGIMFLMFSIIFFIIGLILLIFKKSIFLEWSVLMINSFMINMFLYFDWMGFLFIFVVLLISSMIMFYSSEYMYYDNNNKRFFFLVFFFILSMLLMIFSPNMISILIGWDGLGLISYCLVIYYQNNSSYNSGMLTLLINRIGDVFILLSLGMMMMLGSWNFMNMNNMNYMLLMLIILASFTKSAQFPFSSWLPAAMAAPTPVSSLVHSSTLVTAGVYVLIRFHYLIFKSKYLLFFILVIGLITMVMSGISANFEYDLKKIIAYSTLSQLGLMMMIIGMMNIDLAYFHLIIHAMFKSMMFMCSGIIIHSMMNYQDIRYMGMVKNFMPLTSMVFMISNFSLCGMPFFSGFYSKDQILEFVMMSELNLICYLLMLLGTGLTICYSIRLIYYLMNNSLNYFSLNMLSNLKVMNFSMIILMILTIFFGNFMNWIIFSMIEEIYMVMFEKILILLLCLMFLLMMIIVNNLNFNWKFMYFLKIFMGKMWFLNNLNLFMIKNFFILGKFYLKVLDKGYMEFFMKNSIKDISYLLNLLFNKINFNYLLSFMLMISYMFMLIIFFL